MRIFISLMGRVSGIRLTYNGRPAGQLKRHLRMNRQGANRRQGDWKKPIPLILASLASWRFKSQN